MSGGWCHVEFEFCFLCMLFLQFRWWSSCVCIFLVFWRKCILAWVEILHLDMVSIEPLLKWTCAKSKMKKFRLCLDADAILNWTICYARSSTQVRTYISFLCMHVSQSQWSDESAYWHGSCLGCLKRKARENHFCSQRMQIQDEEV